MVRVFPKSANQPKEIALTICNSIFRNCFRLMRDWKLENLANGEEITVVFRSERKKWNTSRGGLQFPNGFFTKFRVIWLSTEISRFFFILDDSCVGRVSSKDWSNQRNFRIHSCLGEVNSSNHSSDKSLLVSHLAHFKERHQLPKLHSMHDYCIKQSDGYWGSSPSCVSML